jgi:hypothetical protein
MLRLNCFIEIFGAQKWSFNALRSCVIVSDTDTLTDTCVIELPKKIKWEGAKDAAPPVRRGDKIVVRLWYIEDSKERFEDSKMPKMPIFEGYIRRVSTGNPVRLECEDGMFLLKTAEAKKKAFRSASLDELFSELLSGTGVKYSLIDKDIVLGPYRITRDTVAEELAELQREFGLMAYFRAIDDEYKLYAGFTYPLDGRKKEDFITGKNIVSESLEYRKAEDIKMKVKGISIQPDNKRIELEVGDKAGELRTVYHYGLTRDELRVFAESELDRFKYSGFQGSFTTFGEPAVTKTDIAHVESQDGNVGDYLIKKVETSFGMDGYRQSVSLGPVIKVQ